MGGGSILLCFWLEQCAAYAAIVGDAVPDILLVYLEPGGEAGDAVEGFGAAVDQALRDGDLVSGQLASAGLALFRLCFAPQAFSMRARSTRQAWLSTFRWK